MTTENKTLVEFIENTAKIAGTSKEAILKTIKKIPLSEITGHVKIEGEHEYHIAFSHYPCDAMLSLCRENSVFTVTSYTTDNFKQELENINFDDVDSTDFFNKEDTIVKKYRLKQLMDKVSKSFSPEEAYDALVDYIGYDYEQEGMLSYKDVKINYAGKYDVDSGNISAKLIIWDKKSVNLDTPIFSFNVNVNRENISRIYSSIKRLVEMSK